MFINSTINFSIIFIITFNGALGVVKKSARLESLESCGGEYSGYQYTIVSPNYPNNYSENEDCIYILRGSSLAKCNQVFHLTFLNFTLRHSYDCQKDYLEIGDRSIFCGHVVGIRNYLSKNNTLKLRFHSDINGGGKGFKILVTTLPCSDIVEATNESKKHDCNTDSENREGASVNKLSKPIVNKDSEYINYKNIYPVYRPINQSKNNNLPHQQLNNTQLSSIHRHIQLPIHNTKLFRNKTSSSSISTYIFASPNSENYSTNSHLKSSEFHNGNNKSNIEVIVTAPSSTLLLPTYQHAHFNNNLKQYTNQSVIIHDNSSNLKKFDTTISRNNEKLIIPLRPINISPGLPYAPLPGFETQIKTGEVVDNVGDNYDCNGKTNIGPTLQVSDNTRDGSVPGNNYLPSVFVPRPNIYPATVYGTPGNRYPPTLQSIPNDPGDSGIIVDSALAFPNLNTNPTLPINPHPDPFIPTRNVGNIFPGSIPNYNPTLRQCCNTNYATQRTLLTSPGFPSLFYSPNFYECVYTIIPSSLNICRMRFNLKYFNHGTDDQYCLNGYIEIDGRRYCGCKTGLTIVTNVMNSIPKIIGVNYSGYPRSKFSGFLIEMIQESCSDNNYPNVFRSKKAINNPTVDELRNIGVLSNNRSRRELGYSYPKPSIPFNADDVQFLNAGRPGTIATTDQPRCQALNLFDWTIAAKETYSRNAKCIANNGNGGLFPSTPDDPGYGFPKYLGPSGSNSNFFNYPTSNSRPDVFFPGPYFSQLPNNRDSNNGQSLLGDCQLISGIEGIISSPGYPNFYSNNVNLCYRFLRIPNSCRLHMTILDFNLENSPGCVKDYLLFSSQNSRYCGKALTGTKTILEFPRTNVIDVRLVTDSYGTGRGFSIGYVQVPCKVI